ncbi:heparinase [Novosphingobium umbonatum]|uniref:Heparinase n=1 Tax=Novosphingobium umbonatum TaxID=1908524 RepID=A0A437N355_9SPHN|nr:heparinase II/III family protein [Novosphingobium umbonatum]RVU04285.1 heparinase [Novosphingobium umbonatum]
MTEANGSAEGNAHMGDHKGHGAKARAIPLATKGLAGEDVVIATREDEPASSLPDTGRALALVDFTPPSVTAGERFLRMAYRLGLSGHALTAPFRKPLRPRLLATAVNPLPGDRAAGAALRAGHFLVHGLKLPIAQIDFAGAGRLAPPVERIVHGFHWLADLEAAGTPEQVCPAAERVLSAWLAANPAPPAKPGKGGAAWTVGHTGTRLLNWLVHAPLLMSGPDKDLRQQTLQLISDTARWLDKHVSRGEDGLAVVAGWCGIVAAGLLLPEGRARQLYGEAGLIAALGEMLGDDGGCMARSPLAQMEALGLLVRLVACYRACRLDPPSALESIMALMVPPLLALTHGDGALGSWQGGWSVAASDVSALVAATGVRARPLRQVRQWGYQRVSAGKSLLQFDAAPPPLARHARHGCASTLAFELSHAGQRVIVNCGGAASAGGLMPVRLEQGLRATAAHSTLVLDDANSTAVLINGGLGAGVTEVEIDRRTLEGERGGSAGRTWGATRLEASHDGYAARYGLTHRRILILRDDGTELRGEDLLVPTSRKGKRGMVGFAIRFHLGPGVEVGLSEDKQGVGMALPDGSYWQFRSGSGEISIEESIWADGLGRPVPVQQLVIQGKVSRGGGNFAWLLKKMG